MQSSKNNVMSYCEVSDILYKYDIPMAKGEIANSAKEAVKIASRIKYPVVLKVISPSVPHKMDIQAVKINLKNAEEVEAAYNEIIKNVKENNPNAEIEGVLVQELIKNGIEVIAGMSKDSLFGPTILFGIGGIFVELLKDVSIRLPSINEVVAREMIEELKGCKILNGYRNYPIADIEAIINILVKLSQLTLDLKDEIKEIDLNPIIVLEKGKGAKVVDALFVRSVK